MLAFVWSSFPCFFFSFIIIILMVFYYCPFFEISWSLLFFELGFDLGAKWGLFHLLYRFPTPYLLFPLSLLFYVFISVAFLPITTSVRETGVFGFYFDSVPPFLFSFFYFLLTGARAFFHSPFIFHHHHHHYPHYQLVAQQTNGRTEGEKGNKQIQKICRLLIDSLFIVALFRSHLHSWIGKLL